MNGFYDFSDLEVGMRINVEGRFAGAGNLRAIQMEIKQDGEMDEMEGNIESVDAGQNTLRVFGVPFEVGQTLVLDQMREVIGLADLKPGMRIKCKGRMAPERIYRPSKIKVKSSAPDNMDELEGEIAAIDPEARTLQVMGFTVHVGPDVEIEE
jgi:hypothetical protein